MVVCLGLAHSLYRSRLNSPVVCVCVSALLFVVYNIESEKKANKVFML